MYILKIKINTAIKSIIIAGIKTLLNIIFITLQDKKENIYRKLNK